MRNEFLCLVFFFSSPVLMHAQPGTTLHDTAVYRQSLDTAKAFYLQQLNAGRRLYNATEYLQYTYRVKGSPFFLSDSLLNGDLYYDGSLYRDIKLHYDLVKDAVVIEDFFQHIPIQLVSEKVKYFLIGDQKFIRLQTDSTNAGVLQTGFFERVYKGDRTELLAKRTKRLERPVNPEDNMQYFAAYNQYYLQYGQQWYAIDKYRRLLAVFRDKKAAIKKFVRANKIDTKKLDSRSIKDIVRYYEQLKQ